MARCSVLAVLGLLLSSITAAARGETVVETLTITGGTLIDGSGRKPIEHSAVVIGNGRIVYAGARSAATLPKASRSLDATGKFLVPGFADMHNHLFDGTFELGRPSADLARNLQCLLARGITTVFDPTIELNAFVHLKQLAREHPTDYPNFFGAGSFAPQGGHGSREGNTTMESESAVRERVRSLKASGVDAIKLYFTDLTYVSKQSQPMLKREIMAAIIDEAHRQGLKAYVHAPILRYAKEVLRSGADGLMHGIVSDPVDEEFIALMKRNNAVYVTTHTIFYAAADLRAWSDRLVAFENSGLIPEALIRQGAQAQTVEAWKHRWDNLDWLKDHLSVLRANTRAMNDAGVLTVAGSDTSNSGAGIFLGLSSQVELALLAEAGIPTARIIQMATVNGARMFGREKEQGTLEAGKLADIVILDADPLADIKNIRSVHAVIKSGKLHFPGERPECVLDKGSADAARAAAHVHQQT